MSVQSASRVTTADDRATGPARRPLLTVVVPVYNGGEEIVENVGFIRRAASGELRPDDIELVVVSDGSIDGTAERLLAARSDVEMRVIHYDRNLGKGYAVKLGSLAARGEWIALVDADLDLDPGVIPAYLEVARRDRLDLAIGSKRHPDSVVLYPRSRRVASWCYQQLNRMLFRLDVRDTQVGLKVFSRAVADEVVPLLLVKRFAFDLELLAVSNALGYSRVEELPVRLDYRFTGSGVRSVAVARALVDTAAIFYRLRILRTYQRKHRLLGPVAARLDELPLVTVVGNVVRAAELDYPRLEVLAPTDRDGARAARGELLAVLGQNARPAGNWVSAAAPYFRSAEVAVVVSAAVAPSCSSLRERAAAAVLESRLGGGSRRPASFPGNVRVTEDHPAESFVVRRADYLAALDADVEHAELVSWLSERGRRTIYTPDTMVLAAPAPLFRSHLRGTFRHAAARGAAARRTKGGSLSSATMLSLLPAGGGVAGAVFLAGGSPEARQLGVGLIAACGAIVGGSALLAALRFRSVRVGLLAAPGLLLTQAYYVAGFLRGLARGG
ncbi:MAG: glycosyltransferase [Gemmatimonadota bacterium]